MTVKGAIATNRFGLGAKPGEIALAAQLPEDRILSELEPGAAPKIDLKSPLSSQQILLEIDDNRLKARQSGDADRRSIQRSLRRRVNLLFLSEVEARIKHAATTTASFHERLVRFWSNHFSISAQGLEMRALAGAYEREAIRPHILGKFEDLAAQAVFHPAMMIYLDNRHSIGPSTRHARATGSGLNENLAREVLELHTVSPAAQYTQADVEAFAKALTGWTIAKAWKGRSEQGRTSFVPAFHEPGPQTLLRRRYGDDGANQAKSILLDLSAHPATARHVATKLARHFVSDDPPVSLIDRLSERFIETGGDLKAVYTALVASPEAWTSSPEKIKTPDELLISTARLIGMEKTFDGGIQKIYTSFGQRPFLAPSPEGWPDQSNAWLGPDAVTKRIEWANDLAIRHTGLDAREFLVTGLSERMSPRTLRLVAEAPTGADAMVLALMSPDFQRR